MACEVRDDCFMFVGSGRPAEGAIVTRLERRSAGIWADFPLDVEQLGVLDTDTDTDTDTDDTAHAREATCGLLRSCRPWVGTSPTSNE